MKTRKLQWQKNIFVGISILVVLGCGGQKQTSQETEKEIKPEIGEIRRVISTTGTVLPKNRLEIKPPVSGRVEQILVKEGEKVKVGQILAWMSSTERAALLDAARGQGEEVVAYWKETYKAIPLMSPIAGEVIVATTRPGQTITTSEAVLVLSDQLIVRAQVDETDIGKIKIKQKAEVKLDAYPDDIIQGVVEHVYFESQTINNVTIYKVDILLELVPEFFRSGMNAAVDFIEQQKKDVLFIADEAVIKDQDNKWVWVKAANGKIEKREVVIGLSDDKNIEIVSGVTSNDLVIVRSKKYELKKTTTTKNPFLPSRPNDRNKRR